MTAPWPAEILQLLAGPVDSIEKIEVLLLMWRGGEEACTIASAAERLHLPAENVSTALDELTVTGMLLVAGDGYRLAGPASKDWVAVVHLCQLYEADRLLVLKEMNALAMDRIRTSAARAFSDAFRFRRRDPGKGGSDA